MSIMVVFGVQGGTLGRILVAMATVAVYLPGGDCISGVIGVQGGGGLGLSLLLRLLVVGAGWMTRLSRGRLECRRLSGQSLSLEMMVRGERKVSGRSRCGLLKVATDWL